MYGVGLPSSCAFFLLLFSLLRPNVLSDFAVRDAIAGVLYGGTNVSHVEWFEASFDHYGLSFSFHFSLSMLIFDLETEWGLGVDILALTMAFFFRIIFHCIFAKRCVVY
jgi:hypothetical protein